MIDYDTPKRIFLHYVLYVLFKRKGLILWGFLLVFLSMTVATEITYPVYLATAKVWVHKAPQQQFTFFPDIQQPQIAFSPISQGVNWIEFLNGKNLAMEIVREFQLDEIYRKRSQDPGNFREKFWYSFDQIYNGAIGILVRLGILAPPKEADFFTKAVKILQEDMQSLKLVGMQSDVLVLSIYGPTPRLAQDIANYLADTLVRRVVDVEQNAARFANAFVEEHLDSITSDLRDAEVALTLHQKRVGVLDIAQQKTRQVIRADGLEGQIQSLEASRKKAIARISALENQVEEQMKAYLSNTVLQRTVAELEQAKVDLLVAEESLQVSQEQLEQVKQRASELIEAEFTLSRMQRELNAYSKIWNQFQDKYVKLEIETASRLKEISMEIVDLAYLPEDAKPLYPSSRDNGILAIIGGVVFGLALAFFIEYFNEGLRDKREAEQALNVPVLASIPEFVLRNRP
jgi:uncharacterized protein involved in exopolysaccharide biosynthesis